MACKQNNLPASTHFRPRLDCLGGRTCRVLNATLRDIRSQYGSKFGVIGDGRYTPTSKVGSDDKADTEGRAKAYTRFDWGIDWKGFAEVKRDTAGIVDREVERTAKIGEKWEDESFWGFDGSDGNATVVSQSESDREVAPSDWVPKGSDFVELKDARDTDEEVEGIAEVKADEKGICNSGVDSGDDADDERDIKGKSGSDKVKGCLSLAIHLAIERMEEMDVGVKVK